MGCLPSTNAASCGQRRRWFLQISVGGVLQPRAAQESAWVQSENCVRGARWILKTPWVIPCSPVATRAIKWMGKTDVQGRRNGSPWNQSEQAHSWVRVRIDAYDSSMLRLLHVLTQYLGHHRGQPSWHTLQTKRRDGPVPFVWEISISLRNKSCSKL
jgi:hypothetical protein